ncbi:MAG: UDP-3-O-(3-hydroxymyristoyl)glucosamine N-acyltransferase [Bacteroidetes bacterium]|nr:UDP-3-O-(3-hydroxymyristoyl)glucosamine N-acyltransferase [Bacteroidota bacterium]
MKAAKIAELLGGKLSGNPDTEISRLAEVQNAAGDEISFISNPAYEKYFETTGAGAVIVSEKFAVKTERPELAVIRLEDPYMGFVTLQEFFHRQNAETVREISAKSSIGEGTTVGADVHIGDFTVIGKNCSVGKNTIIRANVTIGDGVTVGDNTHIESSVTVYHGCKIGNNVIVHSNTVIGSDGFGFARDKEGKYRKIPQTGIVVIEDDVEIGSNCSIDRATIGVTKICRGAKLDNQIQIAHNVEIGEDTVIVAQAGIAGSTKIGKRCMIGGQAGIVGHLTICDDVIIGASVGVTKSIVKPGMYMGYRFKPFKEELREEANIKDIPTLKDKIKKLESIINKDK